MHDGSGGRMLCGAYLARTSVPVPCAKRSTEGRELRRHILSMDPGTRPASRSARASQRRPATMRCGAGLCGTPTKRFEVVPRACEGDGRGGVEEGRPMPTPAQSAVMAKGSVLRRLPLSVVVGRHKDSEPFLPQTRTPIMGIANYLLRIE